MLTYFSYIHYDTIDHFPFKRLKHDRSIPRDELCLTTPAENHSFSDIEYGDDGDDVAKFSRTCALDVGVEF